MSTFPQLVSYGGAPSWTNTAYKRLALRHLLPSGISSQTMVYLG